MKKINLIAIHLRNFKGVEREELVFNGQDAYVYGANGVGKSTSGPDAFNWCLFGKNSSEQKVFNVRRLVDGVVPEKDVTEVSVTLEYNGIVKKFSRTISTKVTNKSNEDGTKTPVTSEQIKYLVDDVPKKAKEFELEVSHLLDRELFKLLSNPYYFNSLHWEERRKILVSIAGEIDASGIINKNADLMDLPFLLEGKNPDDRLKQVKDQKGSIENELKQISPRIEEIERQLSSIQVSEGASEEVAMLSRKIDELQEQRINITSGAAIIQKKSELQVLNNEIEIYITQFKQFGNNDLNVLQTKIQERKGNVSILTSKKGEISSRGQLVVSEQKHVGEALERLKGQLKALGEEYDKVENSTLTFDNEDCNCPTCSQPIPETQIEESRNKALEEFNVKKTKTKSDLVEHGNSLKNSIEEMQNKFNELGKTTTSLREEVRGVMEQIKVQEKELSDLECKVRELEGKQPDISLDGKYQDMQYRKGVLNEQIKDLSEAANEAVSGIELEIINLQNQKNTLSLALSQVENAINLEKRVEELEAQESKLAASLGKLERVEVLIKIFNSKKAQALSEMINSKLQTTTVKLFNLQANGSLKETCDIEYNKVPYNDLNTARKLNVGIDICNVLQSHYGVIAPVFVDNRESVTEIIPTQAQIISMLVSPQDQKLRVELSSK